jgi:hypothetical protein
MAFRHMARFRFALPSVPLQVSACVLAGSLATLAAADHPGLDRALTWVPESAVSFVVVPSLKALSDDVSQLVEATGQGGVLAMGRPIDVLKAQLGVGANLDEKGPAVAYFPAGATGARPGGFSSRRETSISP